MHSLHKSVLSFWILAVLAGGSLAQTSDWKLVQTLKPGARIMVTSFPRLHDTLCNFELATEHTLRCRSARERWFRPSELEFERQDIWRIRLEHSDEHNQLVGAAVGGGIGAVVGVTVPDVSAKERRGAAVLVGLLGAALGGAVNSEMPVTHGPVIYRRR